MALTFVGATYPAGSGGAITLPSGTAAGDQMFLLTDGGPNNPAVTSVTGWTLLGHDTKSVSVTHLFSIFYRQATGTSADTPAITSAATVGVYRGVGAPSIYLGDWDGTALTAAWGAPGNNGPFTLPSLTLPTVAQVIAVINPGGGSTTSPSPSTGFVLDTLEQSPGGTGDDSWVWMHSATTLTGSVAPAFSALAGGRGGSAWGQSIAVLGGGSGPSMMM